VKIAISKISSKRDKKEEDGGEGKIGKFVVINIFDVIYLPNRGRERANQKFFTRFKKPNNIGLVSRVA
jgi:hypothetical protein